ncbi:MAG: RNA polymerase sigma factor [Firmicutes bacterium]|nr:RNA polymerase sigma factor [Bacillota bacterium]
MNETDEKLYMRFLKKRDSDDLRVLLERYKESLTLFIYGYVHDMEDAEELMLDTFAVAASGTSHFGGRSSFKTWLFAIGRNQAMKHLRKHRFQAGTLYEENTVTGTDPEQDPDLNILRKERNANLYRALNQLNPDYRQALYLVFFEGMDHDEAARAMGKTKKQLYNLVTRGKASLKSILERMGVDPDSY